MPDDDLDARFTRLEREVAEFGEQVALTSVDAAAAGVLAAGADRDVAEVRAEPRAHTQGLNALRETQLEQGRRSTDCARRCGHRAGRCAPASPRSVAAWLRSLLYSQSSQDLTATLTATEPRHRARSTFPGDVC